MKHYMCGMLGRAALALALIGAGGGAWAQAPSAPAANLERAATLVQAREFERAAAMLRALLSSDPANRRAEELLAFSLESLGDLEGERRVRSALAAQFPGDPRVQMDYGRVLERSGEDAEALQAYRRARELSGNAPAPDLDAAIARMRGRTAVEVGAPLAVMSDPDASASSLQAGAAIPLGSRHHLALLATHATARGRTLPHTTTSSEAFSASMVLQRGAGTSLAGGPRLHVVSPPGGSTKDVGVGGAIAAQAPLGRLVQAEAKGEVETPWDEAAVAVLHGGRSTSAEGHLYSPWFSRRLLLQAGVRRRRLSILAADPQSVRPEAWQTLALAGADLVVWRKPAAAVRGEMLDEALVAPTTLSSALTLAYRHYDVSTRATSEFATRIGVVPRARVDEASATATLASARGRLGVQLSGGLSHDPARQARAWRAGGTLIWAPIPATRFALGYEEDTEVATGLLGQRRAGWLSFHVDL